jgi:uncharacterized membrane protein
MLETPRPLDTSSIRAQHLRACRASRTTAAATPPTPAHPPGRRARRIRHPVRAAILLSAAATTATPALGQSFRYSVTIIPPLPGHSSVSTNAINNRGEVVGVSYGSPINNQAPYIYRPGVGVQALPFPPGRAFSVPTDINDNGVIVGYAQTSWIDEGNPVAWRLENGVFTLMPVVSYGNAISNDGVMVGRACLSGSNLSCFFRHSPATGFQTFGSTTGYTVTNYHLIDINNVGQMAFSGAADPAYRREADGTLTPITPATPPYRGTFIWNINDAGQVTGRWAYNLGSQYFSRAFVWSPETGAVVVGIPNLHVRPKGLNNLGHVVGETGSNQDSTLDTWIWTPQRGNEDLDPLIDPALQIVTTGVSGINDAGQIIGRGTRLTPPVVDIQFILTPVPQPCPADFNTDGTVTPSDVAAFVNAWFADLASGTLQADFNHDGAVTPSDVAAFVNAWLAALAGPCP